jgi:hypothetical protein
MELGMGYAVKQGLESVGESRLDAALRDVLHSRLGRIRSDRNPSGGAAPRFEPVTVGAAARVLRLHREGGLSAREARFYLRELAAMDAHAGAGAVPALVRAARLKSEGNPGAQDGRRGVQVFGCSGSQRSVAKDLNT